MKNKLTRKGLQKLQALCNSEKTVTSGAYREFQMAFGPGLSPPEKALGVFRMGLESLPLIGKTKEEILQEMKAHFSVGIQDGWFTEENSKHLLIYLSVMLDRVSTQG